MTKAIQEKVILNEIKEISLNRIGGNIPKYFDDKQDCISEMMFYGCFEHPLKLILSYLFSCLKIMILCLIIIFILIVQ